MSFLLEYFKSPRMIGAVAPSSRRLTAKMMMPILFDKANVIVEYGPGTGAFTKEIILRRNIRTVLILIEQNEKFVTKLNKELGKEPTIHIIHGRAEKVNEYLMKYGFQSADYIVSGLPFTSLPKETSNEILQQTKKAIGRRGRFITFQYSMAKKNLFEHYFKICGHLMEMKNLPPAHVLVMKNYKDHNSNSWKIMDNDNE